MKKFLSMLSLLVVFLVASQQVSAYKGICIRLDAMCEWCFAYIITDDNGNLIYYGYLNVGDNNEVAHVSVFGERPEGWIVKPNKGGINVFAEIDRILSDNILHNTPLCISEELSSIITIEVDTNGKQFLRFNLSNTLNYDPTSFIANVEIAELPQSISINTDKSVVVKNVDYNTTKVLNNISTASSVDIPTSNLSLGCRYSIIVEQIINGKSFVIKQRNFCKTSSD